jgi:hypothetical protein
MNLLPLPRRIEKIVGYCAKPKRVIRILSVVGRPEPEAYRLTVGNNGIVLQSATEAGLFYAEQTLAQLRKEEAKLRCVDILDWPDFPVRGFYHDVTRGKVPTLKTLLQLAETCAHYKINQLQLYVEHTYAYKNHPQVWKNSGALTAKEIQTLDARCAELHIDLVPSFSTFGHFYTFIHDKFPELNEMERDVSRDPFCWWDRMMHYTLDCQNPKSIALVREMIREVRPLFRSKYFNLCADETFDLGKGRNKELAEKVGNGRLYVDFLKQIMAAVKEVDAIPMFWGDIIGHYPELLPEIPTEAIALDWDYAPQLKNTKAELMGKSGRAFYICPGVSGWNQWLPNFSRAYKNITAFAKVGRKHGASGLLNTDWGDFGHINSLGVTLPGMILGACASWQVDSPGLVEASFNSAISRTVFGDTTGKLLALLSDYAGIGPANWAQICWLYQPRSKDFPDDWFDVSGLPNDMLKHPAQRHLSALKKMKGLQVRIEKILVRCRPKDRLIAKEIQAGMLGVQVMEEIYLIRHQRAGKIKALPIKAREVAKRVRELDKKLSAVWKARNKPSELYRIQKVLAAAAKDMEKV